MQLRSGKQLPKVKTAPQWVAVPNYLYATESQPLPPYRIKKEPMKLRSGKVLKKEKKAHVAAVPPQEPVVSCGHSCECNTSGKCCVCADLREHRIYYTAYDKPCIWDFSIVKRNHYYCKVCKEKPEQHVEKPVDEMTRDELVKKLLQTQEYVMTQKYLLGVRERLNLSLTEKLYNTEVKLNTKEETILNLRDQYSEYCKYNEPQTSY